MERWIVLLAVAAAVGSGVIAGVFYAFSTFVMRALGRRPAAEGIAAMQAVNVAVINPWFLGVFLGTAAVCVGLAVMAAVDWARPGAAWLLAGAVLYVVGTFGVTMVCNVPLNEALAAVDPASEAGVGVWRRYLARWTAWNHVRTVAGVAALAAVVLGLAAG